MLVRKKCSAKKKRRLYEALVFFYGESLQPVIKFLGNMGKVEGMWTQIISSGTYIKLKNGRRITPDQILLKDRQGKILNFDPTIFFEWFEVCQND